MITITKATKSKSQKQFQQGTRTGFSATGAGEASPQGRRSPRPPTPLSRFDQEETLNTSEGRAIPLLQGSDPRSPGRRPHAGGSTEPATRAPRVPPTCGVHRDGAHRPTAYLGASRPASTGHRRALPSPRMHRPLKAPEGRESQNQLCAPGRTACCDWRTLGSGAGLPRTHRPTGAPGGTERCDWQMLRLEAGLLRTHRPPTPPGAPPCPTLAIS